MFGMLGGKPKAEPEEAPIQQQASDLLFIDANLIGLFVTEPLQLDSTMQGWAIVVLVTCRLLFLALVTFGVQILAASRMGGLAAEKEGAQCVPSRLCLQLVCVFVISASLLKKLRDTFGLAQLLLLAPVRSRGSYSSLPGAPPINERRLGFGDRISHWWANRPRNSAGGLGASANWSFDGLTMRWKVFSLLCLVLPRCLMAVFIAKAGAYLVVRTSKESVIIDTLATLFIADFDNFMYGAFLAGSTTQQRLQATDPVEVDIPDRHRIIAFVGANIISPLVTIALTMALVFTMRRSCSGDPAGSGTTTVPPANVGGGSPLDDLSAIFTLW